MDFITIASGILAGIVLAGIPGYFIAYRFYRSDYAATNRSGDFGTTPRGGFFAIMGGVLIGMWLTSLASNITSIPAGIITASMISSMIIGAVAGFFGMARGQKSRKEP